MKVGDLYYDASIDDETGKIEIDEHVLRTIRGRHGYLTLKASFTWGKRSSKHGDFGWLDPIPDWCRNRFRLEEGPPKRFARSKTQALRVALANEKLNVAEGFGSEHSEQIIKTLTARIRTGMTRKKAKRAAKA
jgi:hypothetical protein